MDCIDNKPHEFIEDEMIVCQNCGLVNSDHLVTPLMKEEPETYYFSIQLKNEESIQRNEIADAVHFFHLSSAIINELYDKIIKDDRKITFKTKLACHLYEKCVYLGTCIRLIDICSFCGVIPKNVHKLLNGKNYFHSEDVVSKVCKLLDMKFFEIQQVEKCLQTLPITGHNPYTSVAACIHKCFKEKFNLSEVCQAANINPISVKRFANKYLK